MKKVLVIGASTSSRSINKKLAVFAASLLNEVERTVIDLNQFEMPIYSVDREEDLGFPREAIKFSELVSSHDGILISLAEHNGTYTAAFKNILDWSSRIHGGKLWQKKPMMLMSTSPGGRGGSNVIDLAYRHWPFMAAEIVGKFSLPLFNNNFKEDKIIDTTLLEDLKVELQKFSEAI